jgi:hypothetical protein
MRFNGLNFLNEICSPADEAGLFILIKFFNRFCEREKKKTSKTKTVNAKTTIHIHPKMSNWVLAFTTAGKAVTNNQ